MTNPDWYQILLAARRLASRPPNQFTSAELAEEARIPATGASSAMRIASAWCSKFSKWGYLVQVDAVSTQGTPWKVWTVTDSGMTHPPPKNARHKPYSDPEDHMPQARTLGRRKRRAR